MLQLMRKIKESIPQRRLLFYAALLPLCALLFLPYNYLVKKGRLDAIESLVLETQHAALLKEQQQGINRLVKESFKNSDPLYLKHAFEKIVPLSGEKLALEKIVKNNFFAGSEALFERYLFLTEQGNALRFTESKNEGQGGIEEVVVTCEKVELESEDLEKILEAIEGKRPQKPQLLITNFHLIRKKATPEREVYECTLELLKREFH